VVHRLVVSYGQPQDPAAFDAYYRDTHTPLALAQPGLLRLTFGHPRSLDPAQPAPYLVAELDFESQESMNETLSSPEGRAAGTDVRNFATGGVSFAHFEVHQAQQG
jgi:uncharacterized protein (TIGR02118 family)